MTRLSVPRRLVAVTAVAVALLAGCGGEEAPAGGSVAGGAAGGTTTEAADPGLVHVHGLGVDPADGMLYAASHVGLFQVPEGGPPVRVGKLWRDTMGFAVVGPRRFLGSGHPDTRESGPPHLGLVESRDAGRSWTTLSLAGQADFHALEARHGQVYGYDSTSGQLLVSADDGRTWDRRARLPMADVVVSPTDPQVLLATTQEGPARSRDGGRTFTVVPGAPLLQLLVWGDAGDLVGIAPDGRVHASTDGGATWSARGSIGAAPEALTAVGVEEVYAATEHGIVASRDGGRTFTPRYTVAGH
jgi:hypothetical protein